MDDCLECFQAFVEIPESAIFIRSRAQGDLGYSPWSNHLPVHLPEPSVTAGLLICLLALIFTRGKNGS